MRNNLKDLVLRAWSSSNMHETTTTQTTQNKPATTGLLQSAEKGCLGIDIIALAARAAAVHRMEQARRAGNSDTLLEEGAPR